MVFRQFLSAMRGAVLLAVALFSASAFAWGSEGHEIVAQVATHYLQPSVRQKVFALLAADTSPLTAHDFLSEATWADRFRESSPAARAQTHQWHFTDIELSTADLNAACFGHPPVPTGAVASAGPPSDCAVDKIDEFLSELRSTSTSPAERLIALKFLLHFVGDIHQPLHSSDDHDAGGNAKTVTAAGSNRRRRCLGCIDYCCTCDAVVDRHNFRLGA
jgi:S1/P1 Nuclease